MFRILRDKKGFTLVEVIVVAIIVAVLAAVAIPLYNSYVRDSALNTAENTASSAASFLASAKNAANDWPGTNDPGAPPWTFNTASGPVTWQVPSGATIAVNVAAQQVTCTIKGQTSQGYNF